MPESPILIVPYMWIGDFVRSHSVVKLLRQRFPSQPIDVLTTTMVAPLLDYMPGVRKGIVVDLPRKRLALGQHRALAGRLKVEGYGHALVLPRTWKAALAPYLAGIPLRTGFIGEARFGLINDLRFGERALPRMVDRCAVLALPKNAGKNAGGPGEAGEWPLPELTVPPSELLAWRGRMGLTLATAAFSTDSGVLHVAPALGTPAIGIFGPTSPWHWAPLNPIAAVIETTGELACRPCHKPVCRLGHHRCMQDIAAERVAAATRTVLAGLGAGEGANRTL